MINTDFLGIQCKFARLVMEMTASVKLGENAIAAFSFAGLTFPGGEMPARLICRPYFCRWKVTGLCLPVLKCH